MVQKRQLLSDQPQFKLRLPKPLREQLQAKADQYQRSLTQEVLARLEASLSLPDDVAVDYRVLQEQVRAINAERTATPTVDKRPSEGTTDLDAMAAEVKALAEQHLALQAEVKTLAATLAKWIDRVRRES